MKLNHTFKTDSYAIRHQPIDAIVLHYTEVDFTESIELLCDSKYEVSAHYLLAEDGEVFQLAADELVTWHAGVGTYMGRDRYNDFSIGIEIVNSGLEPFSSGQYNSLLALLRDLKAKYDINHIVGHSDIAPQRKRDPGPFFDWQLLAKEGLIGQLPTARPARGSAASYNFGDSGKQIITIQQQFAAIGYDVMLNGMFDEHFNLVVRAFLLRYYPEYIRQLGAKVCFDDNYRYNLGPGAVAILNSVAKF